MIELHDMPSTEPGNPFWFDAISVGASLEAIGLPHVYVMDSGRLGHGLYLVNSETGQRVKVRGISPDNLTF